jgi:hypothetical protein
MNRRRFLQIAAAIPAMPLADVLIEAAKPKIFYSIPQNPRIDLRFWGAHAIDEQNWGIQTWYLSPGQLAELQGQVNSLADQRIDAMCYAVELESWKKEIPALIHADATLYDKIHDKGNVEIARSLTGIVPALAGDVPTYSGLKRENYPGRLSEEITLEEAYRRYPKLGRIKLDGFDQVPEKIEKSVESLRSIAEGFVNGIRRISEAIS